MASLAAQRGIEVVHKLTGTLGLAAKEASKWEKT